jgi:NlpC/P60 family putative phage cell wall peptidase
MTPVQQELVLAEATSWLGTPYHHAQCVKGAGVDCAMILTDVYHKAGLIPLIDPRPYPPDWHLHRSAERYLGWVEQYADEIDENEAAPGDLVLFRFGRCVSHGAIVMSWPMVLHAYRPEHEVVLTDVGRSVYLTSRLSGFYRVRS